MENEVIMKWRTGHGILILYFLTFLANAVPTPTVMTTTETELSEDTDSTPFSTPIEAVLFNSTLVGQSEMLNSSTSASPSSSPEIHFSRLLTESENATETSSLIISVRTGKAIDPSSAVMAQQLITVTSKTANNGKEEEDETEDDKDEFVKSAPTEDSKEKLSSEEEKFIREQTGEGDENDSPPAPSTSPKQEQVPASAPESISPNAKSVAYFDPSFFGPPPEPSTTRKPVDPRDKMIKEIFGGECTWKIWNYCSRIKFWGGNYLVPNHRNPGEMIVKENKIRCRESPSSDICLKNGWTVQRCHMLCMSQCNIDYMNDYDDVVQHQGACTLPIL